MSEKTIRGMTENALKGKYNGGSVPLGFRVDSEQHFQLDPLTASIVKEKLEALEDEKSHAYDTNLICSSSQRTTRNTPLRA